MLLRKNIKTLKEFSYNKQERVNLMLIKLECYKKIWIDKEEEAQLYNKKQLEKSKVFYKLINK